MLFENSKFGIAEQGWASNPNKKVEIFKSCFVDDW